MAPGLLPGYAKMYVAKWKRLALLLLLVWIVVTYLVISPLRCAGGPGEAAELQQRLARASAELLALRQENNNLIAQLNSVSGGEPAPYGQGPSEEYEDSRRRLATNTKDLWYYLKNELTNLFEQGDRNLPQVNVILEEVAARKRDLAVEHERLAAADGHAGWRAAEAANVSALVQRRLRRLQHPPDCLSARKVLCHLNKGCGFGCQLHHIVYCLIFAYATERTLLINSKGWRYNTKGWDNMFHPLSDNCTSTYYDRAVPWPATYDAKVVSLPFVDSIMQKPKFLPLTVPKDLAHRIVRFNGDPASWWVGQMLKFVFRPKEPQQKLIAETIERLDFHNPIVGVHIRRTDKVGTEAAFHHVDEYMRHVADYYAAHPAAVRRVYLATDDPHALEDARRKYPEYTFIGDASIAKSAATNRYSPASLAGLLVDLQLLARSDYLVCTFSSQVGRTVYEMMQANRVDASESVHSLDDIYYFGGQNAHDRRARTAHAARHSKELALEPGDLIGVSGNLRTGYGSGTNRRTNLNGMFPWYKTSDQLVTYQFPLYRDVPLAAPAAPAAPAAAAAAAAAAPRADNTL